MKRLRRRFATLVLLVGASQDRRVSGDNTVDGHVLALPREQLLHRGVPKHRGARTVSLDQFDANIPAPVKRRSTWENANTPPASIAMVAPGGALV